jgi:MOSC domain-containing protein YiiM
MELRSVNVSLPKAVSYQGRIIKTGIFKEPVSGRVRLREFNLDGDGQADLKVHGGTYKAVYVYTLENYDYWRRELGRDDLTYGQFGENFTVEGMPEDEVHVGDVFRVGQALMQVTQPRVPCFKLGLKMGDPAFVKKFLASERSGFYMRVVEEGEVGAGDEIKRVKVDPERMSVRDIHHLLYFDKTNVEAAKKALRIPALAPGWREAFEAMAALTVTTY